MRKSGAQRPSETPRRRKMRRDISRWLISRPLSRIRKTSIKDN